MLVHKPPGRGTNDCQIIISRRSLSSTTLHSIYQLERSVLIGICSKDDWDTYILYEIP